MAREAAISRDALLQITRDMEEQGILTVRSLMERCQQQHGGVDRKRCNEAVQIVRQESADAGEGLSMVEGNANAGEGELPDDIRDAIVRILPAVKRGVDRVRQEGFAHARSREQALQAAHTSQLEALHRQIGALQTDVSDLAADADRFQTERDDALERIVQLKAQLERVDEEREKLHQEAREERERLQGLLQNASTREHTAREAAHDADVARREAESAHRTLKEAHQTVTSENVELRKQVRELEQRVSKAERDRDVALVKEEAATARAIAAEQREQALTDGSHPVPIAAEPRKTRARGSGTEVGQGATDSR